MIDVDKLTDADIGREVKFTKYRQMELGNITSWNKAFIFVRYHTEIREGIAMPMSRTGSQATSPEDLEFV